MRYIYRCSNDHQFMDERPDLIRKLHEDCGAMIVGASAGFEGEPEIICRICGAPENASYGNDVRKNMLRKKICFTCDFWQEKITWREIMEPRAIVISGSHYWIDPDEEDRRWSGFAGREFKIKTHAGREIITHNLWRQGQIPERFRDILTDNAVFMN